MRMACVAGEGFCTYEIMTRAVDLPVGDDFPSMKSGNRGKYFESRTGRIESSNGFVFPSPEALDFIEFFLADSRSKFVEVEIGLADQCEDFTGVNVKSHCSA